MSRPSDSECSAYFKAIGDPGRLKIVRLLQSGPRCVGEIAQQLGLPLANASHHLQQLKKAHVITSNREGRSIIYSLAPRIAKSGSGGQLDVLDFGCCRVDLGEAAKRD